MKKRAKTAALFCVTVLAAGLLFGCGEQFNASLYINALLDNSYKNDSAAFVEQKLGTAEEAAALYEEGISRAVSTILINEDNESFTLSDELMDEYKGTFEDIFRQTAYTVGAAERQEDGSYKVPVVYSTMDVFDKAMAGYDEKVDAYTEQLSAAAVMGEPIPDEEGMYDMLFTLLKDCLNESLSDISYAEPQETVIHVELRDGVYTPDQKDMEALEYHLLGLD